MMNYKFQTIHIEPISSCNLKCTHCRLQLDQYEAKNKIISYDNIIKLLDETQGLHEKTMTLNLQGTGEASLHPQFADIILEAKKRNFHVITTSNLLSRKKEDFKKYFELGLDKLTVSVDTFNTETIKITRAGTNVIKLQENLKFLAQYYTDKINIYTVVSDLNIYDIDEIYKFLIENNLIFSWRFIYLNNWDGTEGISEKNIQLLKKKIEKWEKNIRIFLPNRENNIYCTQPLNILHVNASGYIMPCCLYEDHKIVNFGNIYKGKVFKQYNNNKFNNFRESMFKGQAEICKSCNLFKPYPKVEK